jgi:hypothetical protein
MRRHTGRNRRAEVPSQVMVANTPLIQAKRAGALYGPWRDPRFVDKRRDVVGLYVDPPAHAVVLSVDEKAKFRRSTAPSPVCR